MKNISKLLLLLSLVVFAVSCNKDENNSISTKQEMKANAQMDEISDDVSKIVDDQFDAQFGLSGKTVQNTETFLPNCAEVVATVSGSTWTRTITFTNCTMPNGNVLDGQIIVSGNTNPDLPVHVINYSFINFHHNNILIEGNRTVTRTLESTATLEAIHPVAVLDINMTATFPDGLVATRVGTRTREMVEGYNTPLFWQDNVFSITGSWTTTFPNGTRTSTISEPLRVRMNCPHIVRGIIDVVGPFGTGSINYGDGTCDNLAVVTINGVDYAITLGN
jgi:hypothetical protein